MSPSGDDLPNMSASTKSILAKVQRMVPPMLETFHKGQLGRVAVLGGSEDYTGAPYFSAMASARLGCDMSHVICTPGAGAVIKTYSPNLMVHPLMKQSVHSIKPSASQSANDSDANDPDSDPEKVAAGVIDMLSRLHVLVIGPGLGRDPLMQATVARVIKAARERNLPLVLDADALFAVQNDPSLVKGYPLAILTPNVVEFGRLCKALKIEVPEDPPTARVEALAKAFDGVTIIQKGQHDYISNGKTTLVGDLVGGKKRSGGQGDTLTGSVATFLGWRNAYLDGLWDGARTDRLSEDETIGLAAFGGSSVTRECSRRAFEKKGRSLQASDLTEEVHAAFLTLFGEVDGDNSTSKL